MKTTLVCPKTMRTENPKSILITGPNTKASCGFRSLNKAATAQLPRIGKESHAELQEDQKVRDTGRGTAPS